MNKKTKQILDQTISDVTPTKEEIDAANKATRQIIKKLNASLKETGAKASVQGSLKKETQLKGFSEIDIFVSFNYKKHASSKKTISDILEQRLKKSFKNPTRLHGSRDYFQVKENKYTFEIIPILNITKANSAKNITDVSPLHANWVTGKKTEKNLREIRLAKQFFKALKIYGAESYVGGFSGYACEILTIHYGSFWNLLKAAKKWKHKQIIDPSKHHKKTNPLLTLNKSKTEGPLVLIDPVHPSRNATAALSYDNFNLFVKEAKKITDNEKISKKTFEIKPYDKQNIINSKTKNSQLLLIEISHKPNKLDVVGASALKKYKLLLSEFKANDFKVKKSSWSLKDGKSALWFEISKKLPNEYETRKGPRVKDADHSKSFRATHANATVRKGRLYAKVRRKFPDPQALTKHVLKQKNFEQKTELIEPKWY